MIVDLEDHYQRHDTWNPASRNDVVFSAPLQRCREYMLIVALAQVI